MSTTLDLCGFGPESAPSHSYPLTTTTPTHARILLLIYLLLSNDIYTCHGWHEVSDNDVDEWSEDEHTAAGGLGAEHE